MTGSNLITSSIVMLDPPTYNRISGEGSHCACSLTDGRYTSCTSILEATNIQTLHQKLRAADPCVIFWAPSSPTSICTNKPTLGSISNHHPGINPSATDTDIYRASVL